MIVRVGWITVPLAERITSGCCFLVAASAPPKAATTRAATNLTTIARMAPRLFCADNVTGLRRREQPFRRWSAFLVAKSVLCALGAPLGDPKAFAASVIRMILLDKQRGDWARNGVPTAAGVRAASQIAARRCVFGPRASPPGSDCAGRRSCA